MTTKIGGSEVAEAIDQLERKRVAVEHLITEVEAVKGRTKRNEIEFERAKDKTGICRGAN